MVALPPTEQAIKKTAPVAPGTSLVSLIFAPKFASMWLMILNAAVSGISIAGAFGLEQPFQYPRLQARRSRQPAAN